MKHLTFLLVLVSWGSFSQVTGVVKDSITDKNIPYVNVWLEDGRGVTADGAGKYTFPDSLKGRKIIIYDTGYEKKITFVREGTIYLTPTKKNQTYGTSEQNGIIETGWTGSPLIRTPFQLINEPTIMAKYFPSDKKTKRHPFIKAVKGVLVFDDSEKALSYPIIKLRLFKVDKKGNPEEEIETDGLIISLQNQEFIVDLSKQNLIMPENGIFVGIEWLLIERNKNINSKKISYFPLIAFYPTKEDDFWEFKGNWKKRDKNPETGKYEGMAMSLILTN